MFLRSCLMAIATLAAAGCAGSGYNGSYDTYPGEAYYDPYYDYYGGPSYYEGPYHGGLGYHPYFHDLDDHHYDHDHDDDDDRYFRPARGVTCDRERDVCYDKHGLDYQATQRYLGEREANRSWKKYGKDVFLFSPREGVTCDRRTETCSNSRWTKRLFSDEPAKPRKSEPRNTNRRLKLQDDDDAAVERVPPALRDRPKRMVDKDDDATRRSLLKRQQVDDDSLPRQKLKRDRPERQKQKPERRGSGECPPKGCS
jgi:hypothetical protein